MEVFDAQWELHHGPGCRSCPPGIPGKREGKASSREVALKTHSIGTRVPREFADIRGRRKMYIRGVHDFSMPYGRVRYPDGDWEELGSEEVS